MLYIKKIGAALVLLLLLASCSPKVFTAFLSVNDITTDTSNIPAQKNTSCTEFRSYIPDTLHPEYTPMRYIRVRFFIVRHDEHDLQQFDLPSGIEFAKTLVAGANAKLGTNEKMVLPEGNTTPVVPINYQFVIWPDPNDPGDEGVKVIYDTELAYFNKKTSQNGFYDSRLYEKYAIHKDSVLNIFMVEHHPDSTASPTYKASIDGVGFSQWLKLVGYYHGSGAAMKDDGSIYFDKAAVPPGLMNHELGHTLGLSHTWTGNDGCDDTPSHPNCWDQNSQPCKESGLYSNNMMDYNNRQIALTPCQIGKIQYNLARDNSVVRKFLDPVWCVYKKNAGVTIPAFSDITWSGSHDLEGDIVVGNNATLTIQCRVSLPKGAKITVKPKGTLILDGATITNLCGDLWDGIELQKSSKSSGKVIFRNNPQILKVSHPL